MPPGSSQTAPGSLTALNLKVSFGESAAVAALTHSSKRPSAYKIDLLFIGFLLLEKWLRSCTPSVGLFPRNKIPHHSRELVGSRSRGLKRESCPSEVQISSRER